LAPSFSSSNLQANPFLGRFDRDSARSALQTPLAFLLQRTRQMRELAQTDRFARQVVSDFLLDNDALFARLTLSEDELKLYERIHTHRAPQAPTPDLVIYLQADTHTLIERVTQRANPREAGITPAHLGALAASYKQFFHHDDGAPLLLVNTEHLNPIDRDGDLALLLARLGGMRGRRDCFNLAA
jgi:deoxyguanosine kinase